MDAQIVRPYRMSSRLVASVVSKQYRIRPHCVPIERSNTSQ